MKSKEVKRQEAESRQEVYNKKSFADKLKTAGAKQTTKLHRKEKGETNDVK